MKQTRQPVCIIKQSILLRCLCFNVKPKQTLWVTHRHLRNIDCLSFAMCPLLAPVLIVNRLLFFFFFFCCGHLQNYWSKQGRRYAPLSSLYYYGVTKTSLFYFNFSLVLQPWPPTKWSSSLASSSQQPGHSETSGPVRTTE